MGEMDPPTSADYNRDRIQSQESRISELERKVYELVAHCDKHHGFHNCCERRSVRMATLKQFDARGAESDVGTDRLRSKRRQ